MFSSASFPRFVVPVYLIVALSAIFYLPTKIATPYAISDSYIFGYSNKAGIVLILLFGVGLGVLGRLAHWSFPMEGASDRVSPRVFWSCLLASILLCGVMYGLTARSGSFGESFYLIERLGLAAKGLRPYRDFEFAYGALFLYGPLLLSRLPGLSVVNAYYLFWLLNVVAGVWLLRVIIDGIDYPGERRNQIFLMIFPLLLMGEITTGLNYAGLRFFAGPALALWVYRLVRVTRNDVRAAGAIVLSAVLLLGLSPELALGFVAGIYFFLAVVFLRAASPPRPMPYIAALLLLIAVFLQASRVQVFYTMKTFSHGGINFPIVPALHILLLIFAFFVCCSYLIFLWGERRFTNTSCVLAVALTFLPSALGHCDPGHVIYNGAIFLIVMFLWASAQRRRWRLCFSFMCAAIVICSATFLLGYVGQLTRAALAMSVRNKMAFGERAEERYSGKLRARYGQGVADIKLAELQLMSTKDARRLERWVPPGDDGAVVEAPFGYAPSLNRDFVDTGYFSGTVNAFDPEQILTKVEELKQHPDRDLVMSADQNCFLDIEAQKTFISALFFYPFRWRAIHTENAYLPLCHYIKEHYEIRVPASAQTYGYALWSPKR